jgi:hypothetical protein
MAEKENEDTFKKDITAVVKRLASEQGAIKKVISAKKKKTKLRERITGLGQLKGLKGL